MSRSLKNLELMRSALPLMLMSLVLTVSAQSQSNPAGPISADPKPQASPGTHEANQTPTVDPKAEPFHSATPEELRQAQIEADTKRLFVLSAELRAEVGKTYKESLSITVLKKAEEIEKLARSLKVRMNQDAAAARNPHRP
jgi:hypothetical protein